jgi:tartrate-resistant acid phosphatase type 5
MNKHRNLTFGVFFCLAVIFAITCMVVLGQNPLATPTLQLVVATNTLPLVRIIPSATSSLVPSPTITSSPTITFTPTSSPAFLSIRFAVIGDYGEGNQGELDVSNLIKSWNPDFIITTGDNNYPDGSAKTIDQNIGQYYQEYIYPYIGTYGNGADRNRFFPSMGNHEWYTKQAQPYLDYFTLPGNERYYDFYWGPVHFFALDSDSREPDGINMASIQAAWLKEKLSSSTSPWKIVYMHHPAYSSGLHGSIDWMQWPFAEWGASAVLAGHDHMYERLLIDGIPYFTNGLGGGPIYDFWVMVDGSQARFNQDWGAMLVVADSHKITFQFITRYGVIVDTYELNQ